MSQHHPRAARSGRSRTVRLLVAPLLALMSGVLAGCLSMPTVGPIQEVGDEESSARASGAYYDPRPPAPGATAPEIVAGFFEAMKATPVRTNGAQAYLSVGARANWRPERRIITYEDASEPTMRDLATAPVARVNLGGAGAYDEVGRWTGPLSASGSNLEFTLVQEDGQWRIATLPDALIVPNSWFAGRFERVSRYFPDPTGQILVPETVFVASGDALTTPLVRGLLAGPSADLTGVLRSAIPDGLSTGLSVPVTAAGVADVQLTGRTGPLGRIDVETLSAQFVWTLRQEPRVRAVRLTLNGIPLLSNGTDSDVPMDRGAQFNPVGVDVDATLYGVRDARVVQGRSEQLEPVAGPWGESEHGISALAVSLDAQSAAVVARDGNRVDLGPIGTPAAPIRTVAVGRQFLTPAWDLQNRLWMVDDTAGTTEVSRARLRVRSRDGSVRDVATPQLTGRVVRQFLVSRDGTRVVALVAGKKRDRLLTARVRQDQDGRVLGLTRLERVWLGTVPPRRISCVGWRSPVSVAVLSSISSDLSQIQTATLDGAPVSSGLPETIRFRGRVRNLLTSPAEPSSLLVALAKGVVDVAADNADVVPAQGVRLLTRVG